MSTDTGINWGHAVLILMFCPSLIVFPAVYALRRAMGRRSMGGRARTGVNLHLAAILAVAAWYTLAMQATAQDVTAGGGYVFLGFIVLLPVNGILATLGAVLMLLDERPGAASEPPPLP